MDFIFQSAFPDSVDDVNMGDMEHQGLGQVVFESATLDFYFFRVRKFVRVFGEFFDVEVDFSGEINSNGRAVKVNELAVFAVIWFVGFFDFDRFVNNFGKVWEQFVEKYFFLVS